MSYSVANGNQLSLEFEEWRPVVGYEQYYEVSNLGCIRRLIDGQRRGIKAGFVLKQRPTGGGYLFVGLYDRETKKTHSTLVHNIVTAAFIGPKPPGMQVNHIDGNKENPALPNLEYVTARYNQQHAFCHGLMKKKLNPELVRQIRAMEGTMSSGKIGKLFGVSDTTVQYIHRRIYWETVE